jgi:hypothetical protein
MAAPPRDAARDLPRTMLPIPTRAHVGLTTYDAKDPATAFPPIEPLYPPEGAPNVLVILLDDVGFGAASAFGGPCQTPTADRPPPSDWRIMACASPASTRRRCARPHARRS